ncbi:putative manganese transporter [Cetobacterium ceti]
MDIFKIIYSSAIEAFLTVGVFVSITLFLIGLIDYKFNGIIISHLEKKGSHQIILASLLGLIPGCGGAIIMVPLYVLGKVSFGALVAAFITTMGDAAFIILVGAPKIYFWILLISGFTGITSGILIDKFNIGKNIKLNLNQNKLEEINRSSEIKDHHHKHFAHNHDDIIDKVLHRSHTSTFIFNFTHNIWYKIFWGLVILSIPLAIGHLAHGHHHSHEEHNLFEIVGFLGTFLCIAYTIICRKFTQGSNFDKVESKLNSIKETIIHSAEETAFLITWVFVAFFLYGIGIQLIGGEEKLLEIISQNGFLVVIIATAFGLIPGCGPQILIASLYLADIVPFSALVANAICNDGDALFPLLALNKKSALMVTIYNVIPALIVGGILYFLELHKIFY